MGCTSCGEQPKDTSKDFTKAVVEINNPGCIVLLRKVVIPASMGTEEEVPASIGKYYNVILYYEANKHIYIYSSDGIPTRIEADVSSDVLDKITALEDGLADETLARENADESLSGRLDVVEPLANTALQPASINKVVMTDINIGANTSTTTVQLDAAKENLLSGATSTKNIALPVASSSQAGVMNASTFDAVSQNSSSINALVNGAVAISGLQASPSQSDLTTAWEAETGITTIMNRAGIYDVTNNKVWTYYTNTSTWYAASNTSQVTVNTFTNSSAGTIKGSVNVGQIFAESDGTGSVNGWDTLTGNVSTNTNNIGSLQTAIAGKQDALTAGTNISINSNTISATDTTYSAGTGLSLTGTTFAVDTTTIAQKSEVPVITLTDTDPGEGVALAANNFIAVYDAS